MKTHQIIIGCLLVGGSALAQRIKASQVPVVVLDAFHKSYAQVKQVNWEKEGANFEAEFEIAEIETSVVFDASGVILETEVEIKLEALPATAKSYLTQHYPTSKIKEVTKITTAAGAVTYEVEIAKKDLIFDSAGNFIKELSSSGI